LSSIIKKLILASLFIPLSGYSRDFIDNSTFRGGTVLFGSSIPTISRENPSLLSNKKELEINYLNLTGSSDPRTLSVLSGKYSNISVGQYDSMLSPLFDGALLTNLQANLGFSVNGFSFSPFVNGGLDLKLSNPIFPTLSGVAYSEYGGVVGYGLKLNKEFSVGASITGKKVRGYLLNLDSIDLITEKSGVEFLKTEVLSTISGSYTSKSIKNSIISAAIENIPLYSENNNRLDKLTVSVGGKTNLSFFGEKYPNIDFIIQGSASSETKTLSVGGEYNISNNFSFLLGIKGLSPSGGISLKLRPLELNLGTYSDSFMGTNQRVYSVGLRLY
jgi:hypothetical protein